MKTGNQDAITKVRSHFHDEVIVDHDTGHVSLSVNFASDVDGTGFFTGEGARRIAAGLVVAAEAADAWQAEHSDPPEIDEVAS